MLIGDLTPAEIRVLRTYCELETHARAAKALNISPQTLKNHLGSIYRKAGRHKAHSALYALAQSIGCNPLGAAVEIKVDGASVNATGVDQP